MRLLNRPTLKNNELLPCYLHRLANENGYRNIQTLMKNLDEELSNTRVPSKRLFFGDFDLDKLAYLVNIPLAELKKHSLVSTCITRFSYKNEALLSKAINFTKLKVCPHCYSESPELNLLNLLKMRMCCTIHKCSLLTVDNETGKKLSWSTHYLDKKIRNSISTELQNNLSNSEISINRHIEQLWHNGYSEVYPHLSALKLCDFLDILHFILHFHSKAFPKKYKNITLFIEVDQYLIDWPSRFFKLLKHFEHNPMCTKRLTGVRRCYRDLYDDLYAESNLQSRGYAFLRNSFEKYIKHHFSSGALIDSFKLIGASTIKNSNFLNEKQTCELLSVPKSKLTVYIRERLLIPHKQLKNNTCLFMRSDVNKLFCRLKNCLSLSNASSLLGITNYLLKDLISLMIITPLLTPSVTNRDWLIEKCQIEGLVSKLKSKAKRQIKRANNRYQTKHLRFRGINLSSQITQMLSGDTDFNYCCLSSVPFSLEQFIPIVILNDDLDSQFLTPQQACKHLGINKNVIYDFLKRGFIKGEKLNVSRTPRPVLHITIESIDKFQQQYYLRHQLKQLKEKKYELVSGTKLDGGLVNLYKIVDQICIHQKAKHVI